MLKETPQSTTLCPGLDTSQHNPVFPTVCVCVCLRRRLELRLHTYTHSVSHAHTEICYKAIPGSLPHHKPFSLSFPIAKKTLSSHFPVIFISHLHISNSNKNTLTHQHLSPFQTSPIALLSPKHADCRAGTDRDLRRHSLQVFSTAIQDRWGRGHVCYSFRAHTAMVSIPVAA